MKTLTNLEQLKTVKSNYRPRYIQEGLTSEQLLAFKRVKFGLKSFTAEEVKAMSQYERKAITYKQERGWLVIKDLQQTKLNNLVANTIREAFPTICGDAAGLLLEPIFSRNFVVDESIKPLRLSQEEIYNAFVEQGLI